MTADGESRARTATVGFTGGRGELFGLMLKGYLLIVPTIGVYRFWLVTWKRRFYWHNTVIDGDPLEYTGSAVQLLIGFLFALGFFLPIYVAFFYLSTQTQEVAGLGYLVIAIVLWLLMGYAQYRARDFRLSRTLWRGIRFDQRGSAWGYAIRRFLWSLMMIVTVGLIYPWMAANLWRYRYSHTWYGDRQFSISGSWRQLAGPYFLVYFGTIALIFGWFVFVAASGDYYEIAELERFPMPGPISTAVACLIAMLIVFAYYYFRSRSVSRMLSTVRVGEAAVTVRVRARTLFGQFTLYSLSLAAAFTVVAILAGLAVVIVYANPTFIQGSLDMTDLSRIWQNGWVSLLMIIVCYLAVFGTLGLLGELFLSYGYWAAVARGSNITNAESLRSVRATSEDQALAGEGLADALNVGSY